MFVCVCLSLQVFPSVFVSLTVSLCLTVCASESEIEWLFVFLPLCALSLPCASMSDYISVPLSFCV